MKNNVKRLYDLGFAIHLLKSKSKIPIKSGWTSGERESFASLKSQFKKGLNVGVRLGNASKLKDDTFLAVIDCDVKSQEKRHLIEMHTKLNELLNGDKPATPIVLSGRGNGSKHIYIKTKTPIAPQRLSQSTEKVKVLMPSVQPSKNELKVLSKEEITKGVRLRPAWEISLMGEGQQVVLPPSIHPDSGESYKWLNDDGFSEKNIYLFKSKNVQVAEKKESSTLNKSFIDDDVDLSKLPEDIQNLIIDGDDCEDRSAALFKVAILMVRKGFKENEILSVLTNRDYYLGQCAYDHTKSDDRVRAAEWVKNFTFGKAKKEALYENDFAGEIIETELTEDEVIEQEEELTGAIDWRLKLSRNKNDVLLSTFKNIKIILQNAVEDCNKPVSRDMFNVVDKWVTDTPWGNFSGQHVTDEDMIKIKNWLSERFQFEPNIKIIEEVMIYLANENQVHPVRDYLMSLNWDKKPRMNKWLKNYLKAEGEEEYLKTIGSKILLGMVGRILEPGVKFDNVLILEGEQGIGKSQTARILAGDDWFSDSDLNIGDKDAVMNMQGVWVYELGELSAMNRYDINRLKSFISRSTDKIRPPYGKRTIDYPRQSIFIGTTNDNEYLKDITGNRRFWCVKINKLDSAKLKRDRDQLLAEAVFRFFSGEKLWVEDENVLQEIISEQKKRVEHDLLEETLGEFLNQKNDEESKLFDKNSFKLSELFMYAPGLSGLKTDRITQLRVSACLRKLGYEKHHTRGGKMWKTRKQL